MENELNQVFRFTAEDKDTGETIASFQSEDIDILIEKIGAFERHIKSLTIVK